ncbi:MAG TPA: ribosome maturation factor RimP [Gemmatimonadaceae bacterium]|nr:ribosome maturation factor RimP [Gemmatimonadaceae bacterium]
MKQALEPIVVAELDSLGFDLVEIKVGGSKGRPILDVRIDRRDLQKVSVGDCERASRAIEARLDAMPDAIPGRYVLEVSSPGMERPLKTVADWRRFVGRHVNVKSARFAAIGGYSEVEIVSVQGEEGHEQYLVRDLKGNDHTLAPADIQEARLAFHWKP